nr:NDR1/HIN1-like protein 10 [Lolium perenne]
MKLRRPKKTSDRWPPRVDADGNIDDYDDDFYTVFLYLVPINYLGLLMYCAVQTRLKARHQELTGSGKVVFHMCNLATSLVNSSFNYYVLYLIFFRPYAVRPHIDATAIGAFDLAADNTTLRYDLAPNVTFWSDHRIWAIRYDQFTARLYFNGTQISPPDDTFPKFKGRTRRHRTVYPVLRGRTSNVDAAMAEEFSLQRAQGWFSVEVRLRATLTYLIWPARFKYYYEYDCWLHLPSNTTQAAIGGVKCSKGKRFGISNYHFF